MLTCLTPSSYATCPSSTLMMTVTDTTSYPVLHPSTYLNLIKRLVAILGLDGIGINEVISGSLPHRTILRICEKEKEYLFGYNRVAAEI